MTPASLQVTQQVESSGEPPEGAAAEPVGVGSYSIVEWIITAFAAALVIGAFTTLVISIVSHYEIKQITFGLRLVGWCFFAASILELALTTANYFLGRSWEKHLVRGIVYLCLL